MMPRTGRILVIDDEPGALKVTSTILKSDGHDVDVSLSPVEALRKMRETEFDCVLVDFRMPEMDGLEFLAAAREAKQMAPVIMLTAYATVKMAVEAMKRGAHNYLTKPVDFDELRILVEQAVERSQTQREIEQLRREVGERHSMVRVIGRGRKIQEVLRLVEMVADSDASVLIMGETGTGKGVVARAVHALSRRRERPFVQVDCAALPDTLLESELFGHERGAFTGAVKAREGRIERADGGTLFLDEIGNLPLELQAKLLRVLQESEFERVGGDRTLRVDVRILAATNVQLEQAVSEKRFREDLYYRLNVVPLRVPPLRERTEDIPLLAQHFLEACSKRNGKSIQSIAAPVMSAMMAYRWPGNVRELENMIERAVILATGPVLDSVGELASEQASPENAAEWEYDLPLKRLEQKVLERLERDYIAEMLRRYHGNVGLASRQSGITRRSLYEKMKLYGLKKEEFKRLL
ncbi:MAG: sigma-54-dependent Fis family transcriptional regulator [Candidatus Wallbacteria bacterium]|nr:sigma-54-dependent Fis family transcriptional regulator [Candidatus Wallbacteria bacterium]